MDLGKEAEEANINININININGNNNCNYNENQWEGFANHNPLITIGIRCCF